MNIKQERVRKLPKVIYINCTDQDGDLLYGEDWTWNREKITRHDIKYIREKHD